MPKNQSSTEKMKPVLINQGIGFEWDIIPNYFNKNSYDSDETDRVRKIKLLFLLIKYNKYNWEKRILLVII